MLHCAIQTFAISPPRHQKGLTAVQGDAGDGNGGMDISEQLRTWRAFTGFVRWSACGLGLVLVSLIVLCGRG
jgi:hypothetical protein